MCKTTTPSSIFLTANANRPLLKPLVGGLGLGLGLPIPKPNEAEKDQEKKKSNDGFSTGRWTKKEHEVFLEGLKELGKNWREISMIMKTRSPVQVRTHAQKFFLKMARTEKALKGGDEEIGVEYTSLKKHTAVLSSCLADVKTQPHKYDYEIMMPGTVPIPVKKEEEKKKEEVEPKQEEVRRPLVDVKNEEPAPLWKRKDEEIAKNNAIEDWLEIEGQETLQDENSSLDGDGYSLSSDYDSAGLEDPFLDDMRVEYVHEREPRPKPEKLSLDGIFLDSQEALDLDDSDLSEIEDKLFEMEGPQLAVPFKRKMELESGAVFEDRDAKLSGSTWKRPRTVLDTEAPFW